MRTPRYLVTHGLVAACLSCGTRSPEAAEPQTQDVNPPQRAAPRESQTPPSQALAPQPPAPSVSFTSLAALCSGENPPTGLATHEIKPGRASPLVIYRRDNGGAFVRDAFAHFREWAPDDPTETQLVACVSVALEDIPQDVDVEPSDAKYDLRLLEASSGKELGRATYVPSVSDHTYELPLLRLVADHQPRDAPPLSEFVNASRIVCDGKPLPSATPHDSAEGAERGRVPLYVRLDSDWEDGGGYYLTNAYAAELVICATGRASSTNKICKSRDPAGAMHLRPARYEVEVRDAATAAVLGRKVFAGDNRCPEVFKVRDPPYASVAGLPEKALKRWVGQWIREEG